MRHDAHPFAGPHPTPWRCSRRTLANVFRTSVSIDEIDPRSFLSLHEKRGGVPESWLCHTNVFLSSCSKTRSWFEEVTLVQQLAKTTIFLKARDRKVVRHTHRGHRYHALYGTHW